MGLKGWFPFIRKKGHDPTVLHPSMLEEAMANHTGRVDVMSFFPVIRQAYSSHSMDQAHTILEQHLTRFGLKSNLVLYVDGGKASEKEHATKIREAARGKATTRCQRSLDTLEQRITSDLKLRKRHFTDVRTSLASTFHWPLETRQAFVTFMIGAGWNIRLCRTEADIAIAMDCQPSDIVISGDSDMLGYSSITTLWRPISKGQVLVYKLEDVLRDLGLSRTQLTALAIVSSNDYNNNISSLGPFTNYSIIKSIQEKGPRQMVVDYLSHKQVRSKNTLKEDFHLSIRVFVDLQQTPVQVDSSPSSPHASYEQLRLRFQQACTRHEEKKRQRQTGQGQPSTTKKEVVRLRSSKTPNRFKTVESPAPIKSTNMDQQLTEHPALNRTRVPRHRPRYSFRQRTQKIQHPPPPRMKQYTNKPHKEPPESTVNPDTNTSARRASNTASSSSSTHPIANGELDKMTLVRAMSWQHPTVTLEVGTLDANVKRVLANEACLSSEVVECIREASQAAATVKRTAQRLIGMFIEKVSDPNEFKETDRIFMDHLCARIKPKNQSDGGSLVEDDDDEQEDNSTDLGSQGSVQDQFLRSFLIYLYTGNYPKVKGTGRIVNNFIDRLTSLGLHSPRPRSAINVVMPFTPSVLVRSTATQFAAELKRIYRNGSHDLHGKLQIKKDKDQLQGDGNIQIRGGISAIENFIHLNELSGCPRKIAPLSSSQQPFVGFSESELVALFWKREPLKTKLLQMVTVDGFSGRALEDFQRWIGRREPGFLIKRLVVDVDPQGLTSRKRGKAGHRAAVKLWSLQNIRTHLQELEQPHFNPADYHDKGYVLQGSIKSDGFRIHLTAFKLRELQMVRYRRLPEDRLPSRLTSTVGGVDYWLQEIRNVIKTKDDVDRFWPGVPPQDINVLTLDAGQAYVVGAFAHVPAMLRSASTPAPQGPAVTLPSTSMSTQQEPATTPTQSTVYSGLAHDTATAPPIEAEPATFMNLAVNQKAVYQPTFRFRRWLESEKAAIPDGETESVAAIESRLPPLRGTSSSVIDYVKALEEVEDRLLNFYTGDNHTYKKHKWDMERARQTEYRVLADRLLGVVGGSIGRIKADSVPVLIAVGLGQFKSNGRLSSLHSSFLRFFIQTARSLGYLVMGINEFYTSKKCPSCQEFVGQVNLRRLYCSTCKAYHHRDVMAAHNMYNAIRGHLEHQQRPLYLQPRAQDGSYPWMSLTTSTTGTISGTSFGPSSSAYPPTRRKRAASVSTQNQVRVAKKAK